MVSIFIWHVILYQQWDYANFVQIKQYIKDSMPLFLKGNASVESGFSVNAEVDKSMLQHVRGAHSLYQECLLKKV